ncbi:sugar-binding domain-containing protein [Algoriphagus antarcticus]|uniref:Beta-galactosidase n=1 Tax=Algoriphagus antarcticus TaxID=238540 RepID=A0A3E0D6B8_9BACT|nr:sugar-binding domain-containing protein [Algoriphagus antarcticus]REG78250.1 beta-galactosidase [Algoriphagus antarcticus]
MKTQNLFSIPLLFLFTFCLWQTSLGQVKSGDSFLDLNGTWSFKIDPYNLGMEKEWFIPATSIKGSWDELEVPGNWDLRNEYAHYAGIAWFQKSFEVPQNWDGKNIQIHFEAVSQDATVWINGKMVGKNNSGFLPFTFDITPFIQQGQANEVTLLVDNSKKIGAIWNWGGIRRSVHLSASDGIRLTGNYITPIFDYKSKSAEVHFRLKFQNHALQNSDLKGEIRIKKDGLILKKLPFDQQISGASGSEVILKTSLEGKEVFPWHFDMPNLYSSEILLNGSETPIATERFGLRKIELDNDKKQLLLNGESVRAMGFNLVPDDRITGNTLPLWRIKEDIDLIKAAGGNLARLSHLPLPKEALDYLDERGIMTFSEVPLWGLDPLADPNSDVPKDWLIRLIDSQYNHPSIIGWSVANEIGHYPTAFEYVKNIVAFAKTLDSTRLVSAVSHTAQWENDFSIHADIGLINKYGKNLGPATEAQHKRIPDKLLFYAEYGIEQFGEDLSSDFDAKSLVESLSGIPYLIGGSLWTFNDYRSNYVSTREFSENRSWGVVDVYRRKKKAYYSIRKENAPVSDLLVSKGPGNTAAITIIPRKPLDIPSFTLRNYRLVWQVLDQEGMVSESGWENLPAIEPGSAQINRSIAWKSDGGQKLEVMLLNPQNDNVFGASVDFKTPKNVAPLRVFGGRITHNNVTPNSGILRIFLDQNSTSEFHIARIKIGNEVKEFGPTYDNFLDLTGLEFSKPYELEVFAVNSAGETLIHQETLEINLKAIVPPAIQHIQREKNGFYVGFATEVDDFQFRVRYSTNGDLEKTGKIISTTNPGLIFIPSNESKEAYSFQIQRVKDNYYHSDWSPEYEVCLDPNLNPQVPLIKGVTLQNGEALIHFEPVQKAIGYQLDYREIGKNESVWKTLNSTKALEEFLIVDGLNPKVSYEFRLSSITSHSRSEYSSPIQKSSIPK